MDYEAINISAWCNTGADYLSEEDPAIGRQTFRGLPFVVGTAGGAQEENCYISLAEGDAPVTVPIRKTARHIIFAHRQMDTNQTANGPVGITVAHYAVRTEGHSPITVPIRERYEISVVGDRRGISRFGVGFPYLAVPDYGDTLMPRYEGRFDLAGRRQTEAVHAQPDWYWLWAWRNPNPDRVIESIEFAPHGPRFIVAGITLGHLDEHPFSREARRPVRVSLKDPLRAERPFDLDVFIDRGERTYVYPLPEQSSDEFLSDSYKGFGQEQNEKSSPAYVEISGIHSATVDILQDGQKIDSVNWGGVRSQGSAETSRCASS